MRVQAVNDIDQILKQENDPEYVMLREANASLSKKLEKEQQRTSELVGAAYRAARDSMASLVLPKVPLPPKGTQPPLKGKKHEEVCIALLSDMQLGKLTSSYNSQVCEERVERYADKIIDLANIHRSAVNVKKVHVVMLGDMVEGETIFPGQCVDEATEALTPKGWMKLDELQASGLPIATYDPSNGGFKWDKPLQYNVFDHDGEMIHHKTTAVDHFVTPNHDMWVRVKGKYAKKKASEVTSPYHRVRVAAQSWTGSYSVPAVEATPKCPGWSWDSYDPNDLAALIGWIVTESSVRRGEVCIWQSKEANPKNWEEIRQLLDRMRFPGQAGRDVSITVQDDGLMINSTALSVWVMEHIKTSSKDAKLPIWVKNWPVEQLSALFEAMIKGDGSDVAYPNSPRYSTTSDQLADDMQEICMKLNYGAVIKTRTTTPHSIREWTGIGSRIVINIYKTRDGERMLRRPTTEHYMGKVWCPTVSTGLWFMRRNGKTCVTGNSWLLDASLFRQAMVDGPRMLLNFLFKLLGAFDQVEVTMVDGNHGIEGGLRGGKHHPETNSDRMLYNVIKMIFEVHPDYKGRIKFNLAADKHSSEKNWYAIVREGNYSALAIHGYEIKGNGPWHGLTLAKKVNGWAAGAIPEPFTDVFIGHYHSLGIIPLNHRKVYGNGSLESDNDFARQLLSAVSEPKQWTLFVSPEKGRVTCNYDVYLKS